MSIFRSYTPEELETLNSNFLIDSWSYSKAMQFARNEKAFEMFYLYGYKQTSSATTIAGSAYHLALEWYFKDKKEGNELALADAEIIAFGYIDDVPANDWKLQKTTPSIDESKQKAYKTVVALLANFYQEKHKYEDHIARIIEVEIYISEFLTINGVDIPIKCNMKIDMVVETTEGKIAVIDHKSKSQFTSDDEISLSIGKQAITYVKGYETKTGLQVDEVWFAENKHSKNKDKTIGQITIFKIELDDDTKKLYEYLLYEPVRRMVNAVKDPDYIYLINDSDNFVDRAELYDFWTRTLVAEVGDLNIPDNKKELIDKRLKKIKDSSVDMINPKILKDFRKNASQFIQYDLSATNMTDKEKIEHILRKFGIIVDVAHIFDGYSSNTYLLDVSAGTKIGSIQSYKLDIANALNVTNVRIPLNLTIHDGRAFIAIECSKKRIKDLSWDAAELDGWKIPIGKDNLGNTIRWNLNNHSTPHLLIGGATGSGKTACINSMLSYFKTAGAQKIYIIDPKVHEFTKFADKNTHIVTDYDEIESLMSMLVDMMNDKIARKDDGKVIIIIDEIADIVDALGRKSSFHTDFKRLLQKGRSSGFRIISATQRASVKVISGDMKVNFPVQVCFRVPKEIDSKVMLDEGGAETLAGYGDGLLKSPDYPDMVRFQSFFHS